MLAALALAVVSVVTDTKNPNWRFQSDVKVTEVEAAEVPGSKMLRLNVFRKSRDYWDPAAISAPVQVIAKDQIVTLGFFARAASAEEPIRLNANVGEIAAPYDTAIIARIDLEPRAQFYCLEGPANVSVGDRKGKVTLHLGGEKLNIDLGPFIATVRGSGDGPSQLRCAKMVWS